ncbi:non-ribosomal peptide synthetase [Xylophilus sp. GOD-11R]|uniref:non-ribosomal peptide synthetase n=1 Tax=Xylophilus sp. GOD-11R TaxID=3089814 RepID=UPI00298C36A0|nr:non-ribosomal peptide synthetase [Xylophilus sp. GOD-11R]WPB55475.1 amino acid adenylation domain-containing protein [Xylophilus sp. GOD-11R]
MNARTEPMAETDTDGGLLQDVCRTTAAQRELWLGAKLCEEATLAYNESMVIDLHGELDAGALEQALRTVVSRHQSLRSAISADGAWMFIAHPDEFFEVLESDLSALEGPARDALLEELHQLATHIPFDLEKGPPFRAVICRLSATHHQLILSAHHIACDGWSWSVIVDELGRLYPARPGAGPAALPPAPLYSDFAQREGLAASEPEMQAHIDYWLRTFGSGELPVLELPLDHARPPVRTFRSRRLCESLDASLATAAQALATRSGVSLFVVLFSTFAAALHRITGQEDLVIGIPAAGQLPHDMPGLVGHCVNMLPLRIGTPSACPFTGLLREASSTVLDAYEHQAVGYGGLLEQLALRRDASRLPLVSVLFNLDGEARVRPGAFGGLDVQLGTLPRAYENFELFLNIAPVAGGGLELHLQYNTDLFDEDTVLRWLDMYRAILGSATRTPDAALGLLQVLSPAEQLALRRLQPAPTVVEGERLMQAAFMARVSAEPDRTALRHGAMRCSYGELDLASNRLARALRARNIGRGRLVGLCLERGIDMVAALLGILKSGAAYVPLDPSFPAARLEQYAEDAGLDLLLTSSTVASAPRHWCADAPMHIFEIDHDTAWHLQPGEALAPSVLDARPEDNAYVIYTSGSTGRPKGVCVPHRAVANLLQTMQEAPGISMDDTLAAVTTLSFDIAVAELLLPLAAGAQVVLVDREIALDGQRLANLLLAERVTILQATPGTWRLLVDVGWPGAPGFRGWVGGESLPAALALDLLDRCAEVWNVYGPTETTVWSTVWKVRRGDLEARGISIGRPIGNTEVWILDAAHQVCPVGVPGEICIAGDGLANGYLERPDLTEDRFVTWPLQGGAVRLYRTGDRGRWRNDGLLEHLGRFDFQLKVRGHRIEPAEIEMRCCEAAGIARCVVIAREDQPGDQRLVAYVTLAPGASTDLDPLRHHLRERLPGYMVPQHIVVLHSLPVLPNGKIDRAALPVPDAAAVSALSQRGGSARVAPADAHEARVLHAMEQVLSLPGMDMHDDFFAMGGHSLLAARLAMRLGLEFGLTVPLRTLFESPTAAQLTRAIAALGQDTQAAVRAPLPHRPGRRGAPLTPAQERIRFVEEMHPGRSVYNIPSARRLRGPLDLAAFRATLAEIARRQPALRTAFGRDGADAVQHIAESVEVPLALIDLSHLPDDQREHELLDRLQELADRPIDIAQAPLVHAALFRMGADDHVFLFVPHHLVWDGASFDIFRDEFAAIYPALLAGRSHTLPAPACGHGDYAEWLTGWMASEDYAAQMAQWKERFARMPLPRTPRTDLPRRAGMTGQGGAQWIEIDPDTTEALRGAARTMGVTLSMLTFGVFALMMGDVIGTQAVTIATPVRGREAPETEAVLGFFNNVLPVSVEIDASLRIDAFLREIKRELMALMPLQQVPFERLVAEPEFARWSKGAGLYQAMFTFQDIRSRGQAIGDMRSSPIPLMQRGATDDLGLWLMDAAGGLQGALVYNADIYLRETGARLRDRYLELLARLAQSPQALVSELCSPAQSPSAAYLERLQAGPPARLTQVHPAPAEPQPTQADAPPPPHAALAAVWAEVMGIDAAGIRAGDNFFDLGGDSLLVMRAVLQAQRVLGVRTEPRRYLFETLGQLAADLPRAVEDVRAPGRKGGVGPVAGRSGLRRIGRMFGGWRQRN